MLNFGDWKKKHLLSLEPQGQPFINGWKWWFPTIFYINGWPWGSRSLWKASNFRVELRRRSQVDAVSLHMDLLMTWNREKVGPIFSRWWFEICFIFGEGFQFDEHIFQMGWNHQLVLSVRIDFFLINNSLGGLAYLLFSWFTWQNDQLWLTHIFSDGLKSPTSSRVDYFNLF